MIKYRSTSSNEKIKKWKKLVLEHRIHFHWGDSGIKEVCSSNHNVYAMSMVWSDDIPIGVALVTDKMWGCNIMVYVKTKHRREGIGTKLIKKVIRKDGRKIIYDYYAESYRASFYAKTGVLL